jgi:Flp pilus assembly protein TadD
MTKKKKSSERNWLVPKKQVIQWLNVAANQMMAQNYARVLITTKRILNYVPAQAPERADVLEVMAGAYTMQHQFEEAYQALSQALGIAPHHAHSWYNRAMVGRYTLRLAQAALDLEKALELEKNPANRAKWSDLLTQTRDMAESERALRGPEFTLEQLRQQQDLFVRANTLTQQGQWAAAEEMFRQVINLADCHPHPWGNLGISLLMQEKYDDAEAALKRALTIDPAYDLAQQNLALLPELRASGEKPIFQIRDFATAAKINLDVQLIAND